MDHLEAIVELKNIVNTDFIERIVPLINKKAKKKLITESGWNNFCTGNVKGFQLNFDTPTNIFYWNYINKEIERLYSFYKAKFPKMASHKINQIDLLEYSPGGRYRMHVDHHTNTPRYLSVIINLNNDYEGGDLVFADQKEKEIKRFKLGKGTVVFFPSNFMYPHGIQPIIKGTRYSIVAWLQ